MAVTRTLVLGAVARLRGSGCGAGAAHSPRRSDALFHRGRRVRGLVRWRAGRCKLDARTSTCDSTRPAIDAAVAALLRAHVDAGHAQSQANLKAKTAATAISIGWHSRRRRDGQLQRARHRLDDPASERQDTQEKEAQADEKHRTECHLPRVAEHEHDAVSEEGVQPHPGRKSDREEVMYSGQIIDHNMGVRIRGSSARAPV